MKKQGTNEFPADCLDNCRGNNEKINSFVFSSGSTISKIILIIKESVHGILEVSQ